MTCRFLENLTLGSLIAPFAEGAFRAHYWEQKPLIVQRASPDFYGDLFTLQDFDEAIVRSPGYVKTVDLTKGTAVKLTTVAGLEAVFADMRDGGSLILEQLQRRDPKLGLLCRLLGQELGHLFETNLFLTPPHGKSSLPHWDNVDVFTLQVMGSKLWHMENERRIFPVRPDRMGDGGHEFRADVTSFTLHQGDLIYIPRGFVHAAECGSEASLHISLGMVPVVLEELLHAAIKAAVQRDEGLRAALPLGFMRADAEPMVNRAIAALREVADAVFLRDVVDQFRDELVTTFPLDTSGQVMDFFRPVPLSPGDAVRPRPGIVYRMQAAGNSVRLNFGARSLVFPGFFREALDFALNVPGFAIRDLPGEMEDEERIALIERLIQEGLVIHK